MQNPAFFYIKAWGVIVLLFTVIFETGAGLLSPSRSALGWPLSEMTFFSPVALFQYGCGLALWGLFMLASRRFTDQQDRRRLGILIIAASLAPSFTIDGHAGFVTPGLFSLWLYARVDCILFILPFVSLVISTATLVYVLKSVFDPQSGMQIKF